jgi:tetratricopeptide (TPR) repeat protein
LRNAGKPGADAGVPVDKPTDPPVSDSNRAQAEFLVKFGQNDLKTGDLASAQKNFNKAREFDNRNADAIAGLGEVALRQGAFGNAVAHLDAAARLAPRSTRIQILRGQAHLGNNTLNEAAASFKAALKVDPDNEVARKGYEEAVRRGGQ